MNIYENIYGFKIDDIIWNPQVDGKTGSPNIPQRKKCGFLTLDVFETPPPAKKKKGPPSLDEQQCIYPSGNLTVWYGKASILIGNSP